MAERTHGIRSVLSNPIFYRSLQQLLSLEKSKKELVDRYIRPFDGMRVLDVGCGPADILNYLPHHIIYTGIDLSNAYIKEARVNHGDRGQFHVTALNAINIDDFGEFDIVLGTGLLHHLGDVEGQKFFKDSQKCLRLGGRTLTVDPVFVDGQHWFAKFMARMDRGLNVRNCDGYASLAKLAFDEIKYETRHDRLKIPYSHILMECKKT